MGVPATIELPASGLSTTRSRAAIPELPPTLQDSPSKTHGTNISDTTIDRIGTVPPHIEMSTEERSARLSAIASAGATGPSRLIGLEAGDEIVLRTMRGQATALDTIATAWRACVARRAALDTTEPEWFTEATAMLDRQPAAATTIAAAVCGRAARRTTTRRMSAPHLLEATHDLSVFGVPPEPTPPDPPSGATAGLTERLKEQAEDWLARYEHGLHKAQRTAADRLSDRCSPSRGC